MRYLVAVTAMMAALCSLRAAEPPVIPIGADAYLQWDRWAEQRIGLRTYMRSTYDRTGGNHSADASHFLYQLADDNNVVLDVAGAGLLTFVRHNHWHGSPWRYVVDGRETVVKESSSATRDTSLKDSVFLPQEQFPGPLAVTWAITKGADLSWVPIGFERSLRLGYTWTNYGTGYFIYQQWVPGTKLSRPVTSWSGAERPDPALVALFNAAGTDLLPPDGSAGAKRIGLTSATGSLALPKGKPATVFASAAVPAAIRAIEFSVPRADAIAFARATLRIRWDEREAPSVETPVALFFGAGTLYNRDNREFLVKAFPVNIRFQGERVHLACYFPMPYFKSARIELVGADDADVAAVEWRVRTAPLRTPAEHNGYFHATYRDHGEPTPGVDLTLLDTRGIEGSADWSGSFVGTSFIFSDRSVLTTLEGDPRFYFDDSQTPQAYGTGTEEWGGGGDYWGGVNMTLPFAGHPVGAVRRAAAKDPEDHIQSAYRFLLGDLMPFGRNARITLEHGDINLSMERYRTVTYWYGRPGATLLKTDTLQIGDANSERAHAYVSPEASAPYALTSRYEWGPDTIPARQEPAAKPTDYAEYEFEAEAGKTYFVWLRGKSIGPDWSDELWLQFNAQIGTTEAHNPDRGVGKRGVGFWPKPKDGNGSSYAWGSGIWRNFAEMVSFPTSGKQRMRIHARSPNQRVELIWLSEDQRQPPASDFVPTKGIVIPAADTTRRAGAVTVETDGTSRLGRVLQLRGAGTPEIPPREVYPAHTDMARRTPGQSEFTLRIDPRNVGVMLRRKLDYGFPNQRAEVFVADAGDGGAAAGEWKSAGVWYLAGSNTCVYSRPEKELGPTEHHVETSNRRFRDDEFLLPLELTRGRSTIRVRVKFTPVNIPLFPGRSVDEQAWTEIRYDAYSWVFGAGQE